MRRITPPKDAAKVFLTWLLLGLTACATTTLAADEPKQSGVRESNQRTAKDKSQPKTKIKSKADTKSSKKKDAPSSSQKEKEAPKKEKTTPKKKRSNRSSATSFKVPSIEERLSDPVYLHWVGESDVGECVDCHLTPSLGALLKNKKRSFGTFVRRNEMERWLTRDKHTIARRRVEPFLAQQAEQQFDALLKKMDSTIDDLLPELIKNDIKIDASKIGIQSFPDQWIGMSNLLSRRICDKVFDQSVETEAGYQQFRDQCLTCHGGYQPGDQGFDLSDAGTGQIGIDCQHCHEESVNGKPVSDEWILQHQVAKKWRLKAPSQKRAAGMADMTNTETQAKMCIHCHVGNRDKGMFITHEMYAAGHPPLPSIELQFFTEQMPPHWQTPGKLHQSLSEYKGRSEYFNLNYPGVVIGGDASKVYWNTRKMLIGVLQARLQVLQLGQQSIHANQWADYSLYDCSSCHHELKSNSLRQDRYVMPPGRPRPPEWPTTIIATAAMLGTPEQTRQLATLEKELLAAYGRQPFGSVHQIQPLLDEMIVVLTSIIQSASHQPVNAEVASSILRHLAKTPNQNTFTYDSCRQLLWAIQTVTSEMIEHGNPPPPEAVAVIRSMARPSESGIDSSIPSGRDQFIYRESLADDLERRQRFESAEFQTLLVELSQAL